MIRFQIFFDVDVYEVELYKSTLFSFSPRSIFVGQNSWFLMQFVRFWEARGAWISMEKAHQTHHKHAKAPQTFYVDVQLWCKAVQVIFVAIMRHGVEFWMLDTQNFNFLKKMKTAPNCTFHPKTFICCGVGRRRWARLRSSRLGALGSSCSVKRGGVSKALALVPMAAAFVLFLERGFPILKLQPAEQVSKQNLA